MSTLIADHPVAFRPAGRTGSRTGSRSTAPRTPLTLVPPAVVAPSEAAAEAPLRLTPRGRRLLTALAGVVLLAVVAVGGLLLSGTAEAGSDVHQVPLTSHVVLPGETLWQIAGEVAPGVDRRETVATLIELNALPSAAVQVGQKLAVPAAQHA